MRAKSQPARHWARTPIILSLTLTSCIAVTSCGGFDSSMVGKPIKSLKKATASLMPSRIPVATVRKKDLKKMPTGADRALAWDRHLDKKRYVFIPTNYKPAALPTDGGQLPDSPGLLPARGEMKKR